MGGGGEEGVFNYGNVVDLVVLKAVAVAQASLYLSKFRAFLLSV